tara:strand:+ start:158 stop:265 length:108 start_codon:yes stop_codon:yes gene_type:complete
MAWSPQRVKRRTLMALMDRASGRVERRPDVLVVVQ